MSADAKAVAEQFVQYYYVTFDGDRSQLLPLYRNDSKLTFEGVATEGAKDIMEKLLALPFQKVIHKVDDLDVQTVQVPGAPQPIILVAVGGQLIIDGDNPLQFGQIFTLVPDGGSFYVLNDVFRLRYALPS